MLSVPLQTLALQAGGDLIGQSLPLFGLATDSRAVKKGDLFAAIRGVHVDGHDFAADAMAAGAAALVTERKLDGLSPQLVVSDVVSASGKFAQLKRRSFEGSLVAVTGSAGKTTTKDLIAAALSSSGSVHATAGNRNNELGVPLTLAGLDASHQFAVIEMGAGRPGDIRYLCELALPDVAVCLNASPAHLVNYKNIDAIATTKGEIFEGLHNDGVAVINADQPWLEQWREQAGGARKITFGVSAVADYRATNIEYHGLSGTAFQLETADFSLPVKMKLSGAQHVMNALAALAVAIELGVQPDVAAAGLTECGAERGRGRVLSSLQGGRVVDDTYNANPAAVKAAIDVLAQESGYRVLILGSMLELGEQSADLHRDIGAYARAAEIDQLIVVGEEANPAAEEFGPDAITFANQRALIDGFPSMPSNHIVWVKASRAAALEQTVSWLVSPEVHDSC
ncbi:MAG: UDP-N-acetylmuramoyl-tripeptide--D-alanyl-D-alanine ligase [Luminiphilus sp.]|nr:UDP-N-acetylmuramoyl-tripeptide--D-alanyl-D-alanine ligase [Luminiphilus sp.]